MQFLQHPIRSILFLLSGSACLTLSLNLSGVQAADRLVFEAATTSGLAAEKAKHIVLVSGDEEYRTEESMPMLAKILSQKHGFKCTVLFSFGPDGADYIDPNNSAGVRGWDVLASADLMLIGTRFRHPSSDDAQHITRFLDTGKPIIGIRTSTHAFSGKGNFGGVSYGEFGLKILGETWVSHHGKHKIQGGRGVLEASQSSNPILNGVTDIFTASDIYGVSHLTNEDTVLLRGAVTESLDPKSANVVGEQNKVMQPLAWLHRYQRPNGSGTGNAFCTTSGASLDFVNEDLRRLIVNAAYYLTGRDVPAKADVAFVDAFYPSFYGFIKDPSFWKNATLKPDDFGLGKSPVRPDVPESPDWPFRDTPKAKLPPKDAGALRQSPRLQFKQRQRIAFVGGSLAERMNLFGYFESLLHTRFPDKQLCIRNFGWPADAVGLQQRPDNYSKIDDPFEVFGPEVFICFFGFNEHFDGVLPEKLKAFRDQYQTWIDNAKKKFTKDGVEPKFVLISPIAFEASDSRYLPDGASDNKVLEAYTKEIAKLANESAFPFVDLFAPTLKAFNEVAGIQHTTNGAHHNEHGDRVIAVQLDQSLFDDRHPTGVDISKFAKIREVVNDKSWMHLQDYRMLNGWYVYGGRRTWDTETYPKEFQKIRKMVDVRDQYIWDLLADKPVADKPDDSKTGEVFIPETMFGTRDEKFREKREPTTLIYPTPEESIAQMKVPEGFEVQLFASEREFPEFANPTQLAFDSRGRLWVSCMINYPQWLPGASKPGDKLFILEDTDKDGKADICKTFYDKLICPTGFQFFQDGVLVVDEPRILFLRDTDGDDKADEATQLIDGIATDDTHHTMGAFEFSHSGRLFMLEGVSMSTALETPWGPFRNKGPSGAYVLDPLSMKMEHFRTPGYGNPWCLVFDQWGQGIIGDGTNAQQHWTSPLSGFPVSSRRTMTPNFDNEGMRPAVGNEFLLSRHFPDDVQGQFIYACVINMHGMPRFTMEDESGTAGFSGKRIENLLDSTDNFFRPVDPQIGPDGALWFGDWCSALIGHMQYSQRDPNRDHEHGRMYRLINKNKPLLEPVTQAGKTIPQLLQQLNEYEPRTRYRTRTELRTRNADDVLAAVSQWIDGESSPNKLCEAMWTQESFRRLDPKLVDRIMECDDFHARAAVVHSVIDTRDYCPNAFALLRRAAKDNHPRVRLEAVRGLSFFQSLESVEVTLSVTDLPLDYWLDYTIEHTLLALKPITDEAEKSGTFFANAPKKWKDYFDTFKRSTGPGGLAVKPLMTAEDPEASQTQREKAITTLAGIKGGKAKQGEVVFTRVCSACHVIGKVGKEFGPKLEDVGIKYKREELVKHMLWPNEKIAKGFETVQVLTTDGEVINGFILKETEAVLTLGTSTGKPAEVLKDDIEVRKEMNASSMPEGLIKTIAPSEFLDLLEFLAAQKKVDKSKEEP
ncbi:MAG: PVC-type heme-binding CxxCH protein [Pirellulaceae bacterium]|nr:PVC-type heme-binding CxxCH protein [Pirellulaceae bacterium]